MYSTDNTPLLKPGKNCWKKAQSNRVAPVIDGENYYRAAAETILKAKETVFIAAWDIDSRVRLIREDGKDMTLTDVLSKACKNNPDLRIYILSWDFAMLYAMEREKLMSLKWTLSTPESICFIMDSECPIGASHHQKILVADDTVAYIGGLDISNSRWDTRNHEPDDPRRNDPMEENYLPFHDAMFAVDGEAAKDISDLFRDRWYTATGEELPKPSNNQDNWLEWIEPVDTDTEIAIARTYPAHKTKDEIREIEKIYIEIIERAEKYIYIENQYFTSHKIYKALEARLDDENCPEILLVIPRRSPGWLEEVTMVNIRSVYIRNLRDADKHGKIRFMHPHSGGKGEGFINIHAKIIVSDDDIYFIGSANLSNRSMGFDTELNVAYESEGKAERRKAVRSMFLDLLGEQLGTAVETTDKMLKETGSLFTTVDRLSKDGRRLENVPDKKTKIFETIVPDSRYLDPEKPAMLDTTINPFVTTKKSDMDIITNIKYFRVFMFIATLALVAVLWKFTPLHDYADKENLTKLIKTIQDTPGSYAIVIAGFALLGMLMMPVTLLVGAVAAFYEPVTAFLISMTASVISASLMYMVGNLTGGKTTEKMLGPKAKKIRDVLANKGALTIAILRLVPVAPFTVVNAAAGAFKVGAGKFALGTAIGMTPGVLALTAVTDRFMKSIFNPSLSNILILIVAAIVFFVGGYYITKRLRANARDK